MHRLSTTGPTSEESAGAPHRSTSDSSGSYFSWYKIHCSLLLHLCRYLSRQRRKLQTKKRMPLPLPASRRCNLLPSLVSYLSTNSLLERRPPVVDRDAGRRSLPPPSSHHIVALPNSPPGRDPMKRERGSSPRTREGSSP